MEYNECKACPGYCCMSNEHVRTPLTSEDIQRIAKHLRIPVDRFIENFITLTHGRIIYEGAPLATAHIKATYAACPFLRLGSCGINSVKPRACRDAELERIGPITCLELHKSRLGWM